MADREHEHKDPKPVERIEVLYVGVFAVPITDSTIAENILLGYDAGAGVLRASIEFHLSAVPDLIRFCQDVEEEKGFKWRLLKFSKDGIEEIDPESPEYATFGKYCWRSTLAH